ncbi:MAG: Crp/Fnr family transcriptional regulator [Mesorhizobium sp.]|nr:MAG: Crp/Fnr family transcriptional regulator [Mesorhizobium sp.]
MRHACHAGPEGDMIEIMSPSLFTLLDDLPGRLCEFAAGSSVFHFGDPIRNIHAVRSGIIHLVRHQDDGSILILQRAGPASILAEASLYSAQYHCDARAETAAVTWAIPRSTLRARLQQDPELAVVWARHLAREVQQARLQAEILFLKTVAARLNAWIAWHGSLPAKGQWSIIAHEIGVSPEALYREMARRRAPNAPD